MMEKTTLEKLLSSRSLVMWSLLEGPKYGLEIIRDVRERSGGIAGDLYEGSLYRMLGRLEKEGLAKAFVAPNAERRGGRPRKHYELTPFGRKQAEDLRVKGRALFGSYLFPEVAPYTPPHPASGEVLEMQPERS